MVDTRQVVSVFSTSIGDIINQLVVSGYSRQQELDADQEALKTLYRSGYYSSGLAQFLRVLEQQSPGSSGAGFYVTHPPAKQRREEVEMAITNRGWEDGKQSARDRRFQCYPL